MPRARSLSFALLLLVSLAAHAQSWPATKPSGLADEHAILAKRAAEAALGSESADKARDALEQFARLYAGTPQALEARLWLLQHSWWSRDKDGPERARQSVDRLLAEYPKAKELEAIASLRFVLGPEDRTQALENVLKTTPHPEVKAAMLLALGSDEVSSSDPETQARGAKRLATLVKEHGSVRRGSLTYEQVAGLSLGPVAPEDLQVGKLAPEIVGADVHGKELRLSDHRGRVTVVVFWGLWCGPCRAMIPDEKALVQELAGEPFTLLGVDTDPKADAAATQMQELGITWRSFYDGSTRGPITTRLGVRGFPSVFVIDKQGVIRFLNVRGERMTSAVKGLLAEKG